MKLGRLLVDMFQFSFQVEHFEYLQLNKVDESNQEMAQQ